VPIASGMIAPNWLAAEGAVRAVLALLPFIVLAVSVLVVIATVPRGQKRSLALLAVIVANAIVLGLVGWLAGG
jgi:hypothetical protein